MNIKGIAVHFLFLVFYLCLKPKRFAAFIIVSLILGCSHYVVKIDDKEADNLLPFIRDGITIKQEIVSRLGNPVESYEDGRIIIYIMADRGRNRLEIINYEKKDYSKVIATYQLVLVFDSNNVLEKHSLVGNR